LLADHSPNLRRRPLATAWRRDTRFVHAAGKLAEGSGALCSKIIDDRADVPAPLRGARLTRFRARSSP
jgi:hypothetical protein